VVLCPCIIYSLFDVEISTVQWATAPHPTHTHPRVGTALYSYQAAEAMPGMDATLQLERPGDIFLSSVVHTALQYAVTVSGVLEAGGVVSISGNDFMPCHVGMTLTVYSGSVLVTSFRNSTHMDGVVAFGLAIPDVGGRVAGVSSERTVALMNGAVEPWPVPAGVCVTVCWTAAERRCQSIVTL
jgi:hypothetical protein